MENRKKTEVRVMKHNKAEVYIVQVGDVFVTLSSEGHNIIRGISHNIDTDVHKEYHFVKCTSEDNLGKYR